MRVSAKTTLFLSLKGGGVAVAKWVPTPYPLDRGREPRETRFEELELFCFEELKLFGFGSLGAAVREAGG